jgi:hypothetical protein
MILKDLIGAYSILGNNQDKEQDSYKGTLTLSLDNNQRIVAKWLINNDQEQFGAGFFNDNILVINFNYTGNDLNIYKGVVVYRCVTKDILEGFWSEKHGDPLFLGKERCFKIKKETELLN